MQSYSTLIDKNLPGDTPKQKYEKLILMKQVLEVVYENNPLNFPEVVLCELKNIICKNFTAEDLKEGCLWKTVE